MDHQSHDEIEQLIIKDFLLLRAGLTNEAQEILTAAGFIRTPVPNIDTPPGGIDQLFWEAIWFESLSDDAALFARRNPTMEVVGAATSLAYLARVQSALYAAERDIMHVLSAAVFMSMATARHVQMRGAIPAEAAAASEELAARAQRLGKGLMEGPERRREIAEIWKGPLRNFLHGLRQSEPALLGLDGTSLVSLWMERNATEVARLKDSRLFDFPSADTLRKAARKIVKELTMH